MANNPELKIRITGDLAQIQGSLRELGKGLADTRKQGEAAGKGLASGLGNISGAVQTARASLRDLEQQLRSTQQAAARTTAAAAGTGGRGDATGALGRQQALQRDAELRALDIKRRADALEARLAATRGNLAAATQRSTAATNAATGATRNLNREVALALPQLTDIGVGLASGQSPFLVAIQQGGQLRDVFGGLRPAISALGAAFLSVINPVTLLVGAGAALAAAFLAGREESLRFNRVLIQTGNAAGLTADGLSQLAQELDNLEGVTTRSAAAALVEVAEAGVFTGEQLELVARAAEQLRTTTGREVSETVAEFAKLAGDPTTAAVELNKKYNVLTGSVLQQIQALQEQGRQQEAATLAVATFSNAIDSRTPQIQQNLGFIERGWKAIKGAIGEATDAALDFGRVQTGRQQFDALFRERQQLQEELNRSGQFSGALLGTGDPNRQQRLRGRIAEIEATLRQLQDAEVKAQREASRQRSQAQAVQLSTELANDARQYEDAAQKRARARVAADNKARQAIEAAEAAGDAAAAQKAREARASIIAGLDKEDAEDAKRRADAAARAGAEATRRQQQAAREAANIVRVDANLVRDAADRALKELDRLYAEGQLKLEDYFAQKVRLETEAVDAAIRAAEAERDAATGLDDRKQAEAEILKLQRDRAEIGPRAAREQAAAERELNDELARLQARLDEANGVIGEQARVRLEQERDELLRKFGSDPRAQELVKRLFDVELARSRADAIGSEADKLTGRLSDRSQFLASQVQVGALSQFEAEKLVRAEREQTIAQLEVLAAKAEAAFNASPSPETLAAVEQLRTKINELKAAEETLGDQAQQAGYNALRQLFTDLASGAKSFEQAIKDAVVAFVQGLAAMAAEALAQQAIGAITSLFTQGQGGGAATPDPGQAAAAGAAYAAPITAAATVLAGAGTSTAAALQTVSLSIPTAVSTAATALAASGATITSGAVALSAAAVQLQAAASALLVANSVGSVGVAHSGAKVGAGFPARRTVPMGLFAGAPRFHSGSGGPIGGLKAGEVPAILQTGERVLNRKETAEYERAQSGGAGTRVVNVFEPSFVPDQMDSAAGERVILNVIARNPGRVRQSIS